jgi:ribonuclease R
VVSIKPFGLIVQLAGLGVTGTVASESLEGGPFRVEGGHAFVGEGGQRWVVGDPLEVELVGVDEELGRIELAPKKR